METKKYYQLTENQDNTADLFIFGNICTTPQKERGETSGFSLVKDLQALTASKVTVHINSYGGSVSEGVTIFNTLRNSGKEITTICDGFACSAASVVFMAGSKRIMNAASLLMIHNAWTWADGNADQLRKLADDLDTITQASIEAYKSVAKITEEKLKKLMANETWILPADALAYGFATEIKQTMQDGTVQQSAIGLIIRQLTAEYPQAVISSFDDNGIADEIADRVVEKLMVREKPKEPQPDINGGDTFFRTRKE